MYEYYIHYKARFKINVKSTISVKTILFFCSYNIYRLLYY